MRCGVHPDIISLLIQMESGMPGFWQRLECVVLSHRRGQPLYMGPVLTQVLGGCQEAEAQTAWEGVSVGTQTPDDWPKENFPPLRCVRDPSVMRDKAVQTTYLEVQREQLSAPTATPEVTTSEKPLPKPEETDRSRPPVRNPPKPVERAKSAPGTDRERCWNCGRGNISSTIARNHDAVTSATDVDAPGPQ
ncbi:hypothetical protein PUN28_003622 [Cardiocondyla obscurior]|uniref:Uncharacterized protein n=1 Tax=Cardiocondyla obscurior TaxID=286306 RepID=A0AAW2GLK3_9HYME